MKSMLGTVSSLDVINLGWELKIKFELLFNLKLSPVLGKKIYMFRFYVLQPRQKLTKTEKWQIKSLKDMLELDHDNK